MSELMTPKKHFHSGRKLNEALFFFRLMKRNRNKAVFRYYLSAFLSAIYAVTEHQNLRSNDPHFRAWYGQVKNDVLAAWPLKDLKEKRNAEVHVKGADTQGYVGFASGNSTPDEEFPLKIILHWIWGTTPNHVGVVELCQAGVVAAKALIDDRVAQNFGD